MLYAFKRYTCVSKFNTFITVTKKTYKNRYNIPKGKLVVPRGSNFVYYSTFFRKQYFRTLLSYINNAYANIQYTPDQNIFYFPQFMFIRYSQYHPSFYFKKLNVKY